MHLSLESFCQLLKASDRTNADKALAVLWHFDLGEPGVSKSAGQLTRILGDYHVGTPNQTALADAIRKTKLASSTKAGFTLKPGSRSVIRDWFPNVQHVQPTIDHGASFIPEAVWKNTRGYIEQVCLEINGCFYHAYYNASAVMLRRLLETLVIEAYEHLGRESEIIDASGGYFMLGELVDRACGEKGHKGISLGRDSKKALRDARNIGNWSAHARRFIAHAEDLMKLQAGTRLLVQELVHIADLVKRRT